MESLRIQHRFAEHIVHQQARIPHRVTRRFARRRRDAHRQPVFIHLQNANLSIRVTDEFMRAIENDGEWTTRRVTDPQKAGPTYKARYLLEKIA